MKNEKKIFSILLVLAMVIGTVALSGCTQEKEKVIIVGTEATFPPFEYTDANGTIVGFDIDMIKWILERQNYTVEVRDIGFDFLIQELQDGKIDVIAAGLSIDDERKEKVDFSDPYYKADQSVLVKKNSGIKINNTNDLKNLTKIGAQTGTTGWKWVKNNVGNDSVKSYPYYTDAVLDLKTGPDRVEALVLDQPVAEAYAKTGDLEIALTIFTNESYGIAVKKGNTELLQIINQGLAELKTSAEWDNLIKKYFE
jgi:polar amino acid transport system substrate-binding protein